jgi:hypothetical protein
MVSNLPMTAQSYNYTEPSWFQELTGGAGNFWDFLNNMKGAKTSFPEDTGTGDGMPNGKKLPDPGEYFPPSIMV